MAALLRATVVQTGYPGSPGYTSLYAVHTDPPSTAAAALVSAVGVLFNAISAQMCTGFTWTINSDVAVVEDTDGSIDSFISTTPPTQSVFAPSALYAGASGAVVDWLTNTVVNSRKVMGRTFFVPLGGNAYESNGTLTSAARTVFLNATEAYRTTPGIIPAVWSRPYTAVPGKPRPTTPGSTAPITARRVPDMAAVLRSRRD